jgi:hypothetical protein
MNPYKKLDTMLQSKGIFVGAQDLKHIAHAVLEDLTGKQVVRDAHEIDERISVIKFRKEGLLLEYAEKEEEITATLIVECDLRIKDLLWCRSLDRGVAETKSAV